ncbi:MAG: hypothetical protein ACD_37C00360G0001 [uncultured bacterium]|nr:MAG: hypothetical protein ACD_37C00360G0001 [uncultured bacterium]
MDRNTLFVKTLEDIENRMKSKDGYEILLISGLLRKLLLDGTPLIHQVNKDRKLKIRFNVNDRMPPTGDPSLIFWAMEDGFDPDTSVPHLSKPIETDLDEMLKKQIMIINGESITVQDLIKFLSNVSGAVHAGKAKNKKELVLEGVQKTLGIGGLPAGIRSILSISRVTIKGLEPLRVAISI